MSGTTVSSPLVSNTISCLETGAIFFPDRNKQDAPYAAYFYLETFVW